MITIYYRCEICHESTAKYKCPGCLVQTCSLPCVKQHKANSGCSGQRDKTAYVAMKDFTDLNLLSGKSGHFLHVVIWAMSNKKISSSMFKSSWWEFLEFYLLLLWQGFNPYPAVHDNPYLCKQCRARSDGLEAIWSGSTLFVIQLVILNENNLWCNLIGW